MNSPSQTGLARLTRDKVLSWVSIRMHGSSPLLEKLAVAECIYNLSAVAEAGRSLRLLAVSVANKGSEEFFLETKIPPPTKRQKRARGRNLYACLTSICTGTYIPKHIHTHKRRKEGTKKSFFQRELNLTLKTLLYLCSLYKGKKLITPRVDIW